MSAERIPRRICVVVLERERLTLERNEHVLAARQHLVHDGSETGRRVDDDGVSTLARSIEQLPSVRGDSANM